MSASLSIHGPVSASARLVEPSRYSRDPFVSIDISVPGFSASLISLSAADLEALSAAVGQARVLLESVTGPPEYEPGDGEAQRIAEVYADARAEQDRGL